MRKYQLINPTTGEEAEAKDEQGLQNAFADGFKVQLKNGKGEEAEASSLDGIRKAYNDGFEPIRSASNVSKTESGLRGAAQGISMGFADEITGGLEALWNKAKGDPTAFGELYKKYRDESRENYKSAEEANPNTYMAGQIGGGIGTAVIPGLGGASLGKLALQGAAQGLGSSDADLTEGDVLGAARDTAIGGGLGLAAGGAGKLLSKATPYIAKGTSKAGELLGRGAENLAERATGATASQANKFAPGAGRELLDRGIVKFGDTAENIAQRASSQMDEAGSVLDKTLAELDSKGIKASVDNVVASLEQQVDELSSVPGNEKIVKQLQNEIDNLYNRGVSDLPISEGEIAKRNFQDQVNYNSPVAEQKSAHKVADSFRTEVERAASEADPAMGDIFKQNKQTYGLLKPIKEAAESRAMKDNHSSMFGLRDVIATTAGGPKGVIANQVSKQVEKRALSSGAVIADNMSKLLKEAPHKLGKYAPVLQQAAQRGGTSLAATNFILQQTDPDYRKIVLDNEDSGEDEDGR